MRTIINALPEAHGRRGDGRAVVWTLTRAAAADSPEATTVDLMRVHMTGDMGFQSRLGRAQARLPDD